MKASDTAGAGGPAQAAHVKIKPVPCDAKPASSDENTCHTCPGLLLIPLLSCNSQWPDGSFLATTQ